MSRQAPQGPVCQCCSMPMHEPEDFGTDPDGSRNKEYCTHCFQGGQFTEPDITMEQMIDKLVEFAVSQFGMQEGQAREMASEVLPTLKRWQRG